MGTNVDQVTHYDSSGNVVSKVGYNKLGQTMWDQDRRGVLQSFQTGYAYDDQGRLTTTTYPPIAAVTSPLIVSDTANTTVNDYSCCHLNWTKDEEGNYTYYDYDGMGRAIKTWTGIQQPAPGQSKAGDMVVYEYEGPFGALSTVTTYEDSSTGRETLYSYDNLGRVIQITNPAGDGDHGPVYNEYYQYDEDGRVEAKLVGLVNGSNVITAGKVTAYHYDVYGRVDKAQYAYPVTLNTTTWPLTVSISGTYAAYTYYDPTSLVHTATETIDSQSVTSTYEYDVQGRIVKYTPPLPADYGSISYTWNTLGQKTSMTVPLGVENKVHRTDYKYDQYGKLVGIAGETFAPGGGFVSDVGVESGSSGDTRFFYDDSQNRVKMITSSGYVYRFVYDPTASIPSVVWEYGNAGRFLNIREPDGSLVKRMAVASDATFSDATTYHFDGLGNTVALSDDDGVITDRYVYGAWGNVTQTGSTANNPYQYVGQLGYYTHYQEPSLGLLQLGVRYYDPALGRFTQVDPAKDGVNYFAYVDDDPLGGVDPTGLESWVDHIFDSGVFFPGICEGLQNVGILTRSAPAHVAIVGCASQYIGIRGECLLRAEEASLRLLNTPNAEWLRIAPGIGKQVGTIDKLAHCWSGCEGARCCGGDPLCLATVQAYIDSKVGTPGAGDWQPHIDANHAGIALGRGSGNCWEGCWKWWAKSYGCKKVPMPRMPITY